MKRKILMVYLKNAGVDTKDYYFDKFTRTMPEDVELDSIIVQEQATEREFVEVVRCKDCRYKDTEDCPATERRCYRNSIGVIKEYLETWCGMDYCSVGKRSVE